MFYVSLDLERWCSTWKKSAFLNVIIEGKLFATQALSQTQKTVSEPQTEVEPSDVW